jgi:DNA polymerase III gamma/tau subunit
VGEIGEKRKINNIIQARCDNFIFSLIPLSKIVYRKNNIIINLLWPTSK